MVTNSKVSGDLKSLLPNDNVIYETLTYCTAFEDQSIFWKLKNLQHIHEAINISKLYIITTFNANYSSCC